MAPTRCPRGSRHGLTRRPKARSGAVLRATRASPWRTWTSLPRSSSRCPRRDPAQARDGGRGSTGCRKRTPFAAFRTPSMAACSATLPDQVGTIPTSNDGPSRTWPGLSSPRFRVERKTPGSFASLLTPHSPTASSSQPASRATHSTIDCGARSGGESPRRGPQDSSGSRCRPARRRSTLGAVSSCCVSLGRPGRAPAGPRTRTRTRNISKRPPPIRSVSCSSGSRVARARFTANGRNASSIPCSSAGAGPCRARPGFSASPAVFAGQPRRRVAGPSPPSRPSPLIPHTRRPLWNTHRARNSPK